MITQENSWILQYQCCQKKLVSGSQIFFDYSKRSNFSFSYGFSRGLYLHKLMYFDWLREKIAEYCSINVLKKKFFGSVSGSRFFFDYSKRRNLSLYYDFSRDLRRHKTMYFSWLRKKTPKYCSINVLKKSFLGRFRILE